MVIPILIGGYSPYLFLKKYIEIVEKQILAYSYVNFKTDSQTAKKSFIFVDSAAHTMQVTQWADKVLYLLLLLQCFIPTHIPNRQHKGCCMQDNSDCLYNKT